MTSAPPPPDYATLTRTELVARRNLILAAAEDLLGDIVGDGPFASDTMLAQANLAAALAVAYNGLIDQKDRVDGLARALKTTKGIETLQKQKQV